MIKTCEHCGEEFDGHGNAKYCVDCRSKAQLERTHRYRENHRKQCPKPVTKPVENLNSLSEADLRQLMNLLREAYHAGELILHFGGQSALTGEQLAIVEQKYPDHRQTLSDRRKQNFFDATDKFIELYQTFK
ncbi:MAG: hypothetical protein IJ685_09475 [Selenomonadaceae bacterium]|nr:hypothetical protein [Selenomonadaceae bacterium]